MPAPPDRPLRLLVVLPSWVGDAVMATPALRRLRDAMPGAFIGALARPGIDQVLAGLDLIDEIHVERRSGVLGPKFIAARLRPRRYDTALLLTNSFSTALTARVAGIPRRIGYDRDARRLLLTDPLPAPRAAPHTGSGKWAITPAVNYYWTLVGALTRDEPPPPPPDQPLTNARVPLVLPEGVRMELAVTDAERAEAGDLLDRAGITPDQQFAVLNPGGNNPAKRWPPERFAALADHLARVHGLRVLVNGSPAEQELCASIAALAQTGPAALPDLGVTLASLKGVIQRARLMVTNDTGPRHIAAALGVPLVSLFGPTDPRWTTIPVLPTQTGEPSESILVADPDLPVDQSANDHPDRCAIEKISLECVVAAADALLAQTTPRSANQRTPG